MHSADGLKNTGEPYLVEESADTLRVSPERVVKGGHISYASADKTKVNMYGAKHECDALADVHKSEYVYDSGQLSRETMHEVTNNAVTSAGIITTGCGESIESMYVQQDDNKNVCYSIGGKKSQKTFFVQSRLAPGVVSLLQLQSQTWLETGAPI